MHVLQAKYLLHVIYAVAFVQSDTWVFWHPVTSDKKMYGPKVFLLAKQKLEYSGILYNSTNFPGSLVCRIKLYITLSINYIRHVIIIIILPLNCNLVPWNYIDDIIYLWPVIQRWYVWYDTTSQERFCTVSIAAVFNTIVFANAK